RVVSTTNCATHATIIGYEATCLRIRFVDARATRMTPLADGSYDAFIVWAEQRDDGVALELTITTGAHRGAVFNVVSSTFAQHHGVDVVGLPCTLVVRGDELRIVE